jgi:intracellular septation protein
VSNTFFKRNLIRQMMEPGGLLLPGPIWRQVNLAWIGFFAIIGVVNLYIAFNFSRDTWVSFKAFGLTGLTFAFAIGQALLLSRHMITPEDAAEQANVNKS